MVIAPLLLSALQLPGAAASAAALPVVINTWAFRKAAETGAPAGERVGQGRWVFPPLLLLLRGRRGSGWWFKNRTRLLGLAVWQEAAGCEAAAV